MMHSPRSLRGLQKELHRPLTLLYSTAAPTHHGDHDRSHPSVASTATTAATTSTLPVFSSSVIYRLVFTNFELCMRTRLHLSVSVRQPGRDLPLISQGAIQPSIVGEASQSQFPLQSPCGDESETWRRTVSPRSTVAARLRANCIHLIFNLRSSPHWSSSTRPRLLAQKRRGSVCRTPPTTMRSRRHSGKR